jgi:hypothetical protein
MGRLLAGAAPALRLFLWSRLGIWALAIATALLAAGALNPERGRWDRPRLHELGTAVDVWARWDSDWFLRIAEDGYSWPSSTPAFFPLYPFAVGGLGRLLGGHFLLAGVLVSLAAAAAAFVLLYRLALQRLPEADARRSVVYLAVFPTSLFLGAVYSEALFLALALGCFLLAERGRLGWAGLLAGLALLTRAQGVALVPAVALFALAEPRRGRALAMAVGTPLAIFAAYPVLLAAWLGKPLAFVEAQQGVWERRASLAGPLGGLAQAVAEGAVVELAFAAVMLPLAVVAWRTLGAPYGLYALGVLLLPMALPSDRLGGLYSFPRLALLAFPCLLALAMLGRDRRVHAVVVTVSAAALAVFVVRWALWYWVA